MGCSGSEALFMNNILVGCRRCEACVVILKRENVLLRLQHETSETDPS